MRRHPRLGRILRSRRAPSSSSFRGCQGGIDSECVERSTESRIRVRLVRVAIVFECIPALVEVGQARIEPVGEEVVAEVSLIDDRQQALLAWPVFCELRAISAPSEPTRQ